MADIVSSGKHGKGVGLVCKSHSLSLTEHDQTSAILHVRVNQSATTFLGVKMKNRFLLALAGLAISFAAPTFSQEQSAVDPEVRQQIEALFTKFREAFNKRDPSAIAALYTENAMRTDSYESGVDVGQQAILKSYTDMLSSMPGELVGKVVEVYRIGNDMCVITKDSEGAQWNGYKTWICNRDADTWKIRMEYVN
jgi:uncharacterized protein (TIGR02246 family)